MGKTPRNSAAKAVKGKPLKAKHLLKKKIPQTVVTEGNEKCSPKDEQQLIAIFRFLQEQKTSSLISKTLQCFKKDLKELFGEKSIKDEKEKMQVSFSNVLDLTSPSENKNIDSESDSSSDSEDEKETKKDKNKQQLKAAPHQTLIVPLIVKTRKKLKKIKNK